MEPDGGVAVEGDELASVKPGGSELPDASSKEESEEASSEPSKESPGQEDDPGKSSSEEPSPKKDGEQEPSPEKDSSEEPEPDETSGPGEEPEPEPEKDKPITGSVDISLSTKSFGGRYGPRNVGAIWIERKDGTFLRTVKVWAKRRAIHLVAWNKSTKGNRVDAVSGATLRKHQTHELKWDRKDVKGQEQGAGEYLLRVELAEENSDMKGVPEGPTLTLPFELGAGKKTLEGKDLDGYLDVEVQLPG